jgi:hypothetical protein
VAQSLDALTLKAPGPWTLFRLTVVPKGSLFPVLPVVERQKMKLQKLRGLCGR